MYAFIIALFIALVLARFLTEHKQPDGRIARIERSVHAEARAWLRVGAALIGVFALLFLLSLWLGPIPQIHEW